MRGLTRGDEYRALAQYDHKPLFNKALTATFPPGSTFKTMVALAALENGYDPKTVHLCLRQGLALGRDGLWSTATRRTARSNLKDGDRQASCDI